MYLGTVGDTTQVAVNRRPTDGTIPNSARGTAFINVNGLSTGGSIELATSTAANTGAVTAVTIDSSQRVGIGTTSPATSALLHVKSSGTYGNIVADNSSATGGGGFTSYQNGSQKAIFGTSGYIVGDTSSDAALFAETGGNIRFYTNGSTTERVRIDSSGRLLVGTSSSVGGNVQIVGSGNGSGVPFLHLRGTNSVGSGGRDVAIDFSVVTDDTGPVYTTIGRIASFKENGTQGNEGGALTFSTTADGASTPTERMRITSAGNVGINTNAPTVTLDVNGQGRFTNDILYADATATRGRIYADSTGLVVRADTGLALRFHADTGERARIDTSGRLLVGTSTAQSGTRSQYSKFTVQGNNQSTSDGAQVNLAINTNAASLSTGDTLGQIIFTDNGPGEYGKISCQMDGAGAGTNDYPGRLVFSTTADGASSPTERMRINSSGTCTISNSSYLQPATDNAVYLGGGTNLRWIAVYAANGTIQTSDARQKTEIVTSSLGVDFVKSLRPVSYKFIVGGNKPTGETDSEGNWIYQEVPGKRTHWGFVAQEVKEAVDAAGVDFGGWILDDPSNPDSDQGLRYDQFIAPLTKALQEALAKIETLEAKVAALEVA
jgi:hypothetical protein